MRKRFLERDIEAENLSRRRGLDVGEIATVVVTSEAGDYPIDNAFDGTRGPGATRWLAAEPGPQTLILEFDELRSIHEIEVEIEEREVQRTQELCLSVSTDGGAAYRELLLQEFNFSPSGATFERESWTVEAKGVTHLRLSIAPDKDRQKPVRASLTALVLH